MREECHEECHEECQRREPTRQCPSFRAFHARAALTTLLTAALLTWDGISYTPTQTKTCCWTMLPTSIAQRIGAAAGLHRADYRIKRRLELWDWKMRAQNRVAHQGRATGSSHRRLELSEVLLCEHALVPTTAASVQCTKRRLRSDWSGLGPMSLDRIPRRWTGNGTRDPRANCNT